MAMMLLFVLLLLFTGLKGDGHETLCTSGACFTLHLKKASFDRAEQDCKDNGGYLLTVRSPEEEDVLRSLLSAVHHEKALKLWIGLKLHRKDCVRSDEPLKGFKWSSGNETSLYSNWKEEPEATCTEQRCVRVDYSFSDENDLLWIAGGCRRPASYVCKFYFKGMCEPLVLSGPGRITYTAPFSKVPQENEMNLLPIGTYTNVQCEDEQVFYSVCMKLGDTFGWNQPGPFCRATCDLQNGGCEHQCYQNSEGAKCVCREGYELEKNGLSCKLRDMCFPGSCEYECETVESGFSCRCPEGFRLDENKRNCSDIDECASQACEGGMCVNVPGGYECVCEEGYRMVDGECRDVDECMWAQCEQVCSNTVGSFLCSCWDGFTLSRDGFSCVDECENFLCEPQTDAPPYPEPSTFSQHKPLHEEMKPELNESLHGTIVDFSPSDTPTDLLNETKVSPQTNTSHVTAVNTTVLVCVLGSAIPLLLLIIVTLLITVCHYNVSKREAEKKASADGYCWVSSGLDPRLEKLYESILTDDL